MISPLLFIFAGPNGCGKTTFANKFLKHYNLQFINADEILKGFESKYDGNTELQSGREFYRRIHSLIKNKESFIIESTLSGLSLINRLRQFKVEGYKIVIFYLYVESTDVAVERIKGRVKSGGHNVPTKDVIRRFYRSKNNFWQTYRNIADEWFVINNSDYPFDETVIGSKQKFKITNHSDFNKFAENLNIESLDLVELESHIYKRAIEILAIGNRAIQIARDALKKNEIHVAFSRNGKLFYELPDGTITTQNLLIENDNVFTQNYIISALKELRKKLQNDISENFISLSLFGSYARNEANINSDVDILILLTNRTFELDQVIHKHISDISIEYEIFISAMVRTHEHMIDQAFASFPVYINIEKEKILI